MSAPLASTPLRAHYDVIIAGGGMVGLSFALLLNRLSGGQLQILIAESFAVPANTPAQPIYRPSFDARATALSYGSRCIFDNLGVWPTLEQHAAPITTVHVSERERFGSVQLDAQDRAWPALGYVVENMWLGAVLSNELRKHPSINLLSPATVIDGKPGGDCANVTIQHHDPRHHGTQNSDTVLSFTTHLLAIADGTTSSLRMKLNIGVDEHDYDRQAIIANLNCTHPHNGVAYERFTDWGPMALLPLVDNITANEPRMALVWTMHRERAAQLLASSDDDLLRLLQQRFGNRQGQFTRIGERHRYDLKLIVAEEQIRRQIVLIGNAAHSMHPVAGQGFNLALRDVQRLAEIVCDAHAQDAHIGELAVLQRYLRRQASDQWKTMLFSDRITALFERAGTLAGSRHVGLIALDLNTDVKNRFVDHTAGFHAGAPLGHTFLNAGAASR